MRVARTLVGLALGLALLAAPAAAWAREGRLDPGFGRGGIVDLGAESPRSWAFGQDGSITIRTESLTGWGLTRLTPDGLPDPGFGEDGHISLDLQIEGHKFHPGSMALDSQGRIVLFGDAGDEEEIEPLYHLRVPVSWAVVLRLDAAGGLDPSFGAGRGFVRSDFGLPEELPTTKPTVSVLNGTVDSLDRPLLLLGTAGLVTACADGKGYVGSPPRALVRLTSAGAPDPGFGEDGLVALGGEPRGGGALALAEGDQPELSLAGPRCRGPLVYRLGAEGAPLPGFGVAGRRQYPRRLSFAGFEPSGAFVMRPFFTGTKAFKTLTLFGPEGARQRSFGEDGTAAASLPAGEYHVLRPFYPVGVDAQGRIVLVGSFTLPPPRRANHGGRREQPRAYLLVERLLPDGRLDRSLGRNGRIVTPLARDRTLRLGPAALDPQGRLVVLASLGRPNGVGREVRLARYLLEG